LQKLLYHKLIFSLKARPNKWRFFFVVYFSVLHSMFTVCIIYKHWIEMCAKFFLISFSSNLNEREIEWTLGLWFSNSGCLTKFQQKIQKLMLIEKSICWVFWNEVFEVCLRSSLIGTCLPIILNKHWSNTTKNCW
jgi:hypothetical protein